MKKVLLLLLIICCIFVSCEGQQEPPASNIVDIEKELFDLSKLDFEDIEEDDLSFFYDLDYSSLVKEENSENQPADVSGFVNEVVSTVDKFGLAGYDKSLSVLTEDEKLKVIVQFDKRNRLIAWDYFKILDNITISPDSGSDLELIKGDCLEMLADGSLIVNDSDVTYGFEYVIKLFDILNSYEALFDYTYDKLDNGFEIVEMTYFDEPNVQVELNYVKLYEKVQGCDTFLTVNIVTLDDEGGFLSDTYNGVFKGDFGTYNIVDLDKLTSSGLLTT